MPPNRRGTAGTDAVSAKKYGRVVFERHSSSEEHPLTPELKAYVKALELVAANSQHLLNRLAAMEQSGVLSPVAKEAVNDWAARVATSIQAVPKKPAEE